MIDDRNLTIQFIICYKSVRQKIANLEVYAETSMLVKILGQKCTSFEKFKNFSFQDVIIGFFSAFNRADSR